MQFDAHPVRPIQLASLSKHGATPVSTRAAAAAAGAAAAQQSATTVRTIHLYHEAPGKMSTLIAALRQLLAQLEYALSTNRPLSEYARAVHRALQLSRPVWDQCGRNPRKAMDQGMVFGLLHAYEQVRAMS